MQWRRSTQLIDANVILRYLLNDHAEMSPASRTLISTGNAYTKPEIIAEVIYVLRKVYQIEKGDIKNFIHSLLNDISCNESECVLLAMDIYASLSLDFVDCLLIAYHKINHENVFSFDKKLNRHLSKGTN